MSERNYGMSSRYRPVLEATELSSADEAHEWLANWSSRADEAIAGLAELTDRVAGVTSTASSPWGEVEVTVGSGGELTDVRFAPEAMRWNPDELAAEVMRLFGQARTGLVAAWDEVADHG